MSPAVLIATVGGVGYLRPASGTWGSAVAVLLAWPFVSLGWGIFGIATGLAFALGLWATRQVATPENEDPSEVVVDELVGQWIALWPVVTGAVMSGASFWALWPGVLTAFVAFRLFDILKPGPIGAADRRGDPEGVMLDDVWAGLAAAIVVVLFAGIAHGVMR